jgi:predicted nuclease of restriction endonuclease-like (RecB) superfamily
VEYFMSKPIEKNQLPQEYSTWLDDIKTKIQSAQMRTALAANKELISFYWELGRDILKKQKTAEWGSRIIEQLSKDLRKEFPGLKGFSPRNLYYMIQVHETISDFLILQQLAAKLPWFHICAIIERSKSKDERDFYFNTAIEYGWSRNILVLQMEKGLFKRKGKAVQNFSRTLTPPHSDLAVQSLKDPYVFDFLTLHKKAKEKDLELQLTSHLKSFLLELGVGFAFVGLDIGQEKIFYWIVLSI